LHRRFSPSSPRGGSHPAASGSLCLCHAILSAAVAQPPADRPEAHAAALTALPCPLAADNNTTHCAAMYELALPLLTAADTQASRPKENRRGGRAAGGACPAVLAGGKRLLCSH
jgi:hypothetical protein